MLPKPHSRHSLEIETLPARHRFEIETPPAAENQLLLAAEVRMPGLHAGEGKGVARAARVARVARVARLLDEQVEMHRVPGLSEEVEVHHVLGLTVGVGLEGEKRQPCAQGQRPPCAKPLVADGSESGAESKSEVWTMSRRHGQRLVARRPQTFLLWLRRRHLLLDGRRYFL